MKRASVVLFVLISGLVLTCNAILSPFVSATALDPGWMSGEVKYEAFDATPLLPKRCENEYRKIASIRGHIYTTLEQAPDLQVCVYKNKSFEYAEYSRDFYIDPTKPQVGTLTESGVALSSRGAPALIPTDLDATTFEIDRLYTGSDSDVFIRQAREGSTYTLTLSIYDNPVHYLTTGQDGVSRLDVDQGYRLKAKSSDGSDYIVSALGGSVSMNGRYAAFAVENLGYAVVDLVDKKGKLVNKTFRTTLDVSPKPRASIAVDDAGRYVVVGGWNVETRVFDASSSDCGFDFSDVISVEQRSFMQECVSRDFTQLTNSHSPGRGYYTFLGVYMSSRGDSFSYFDSEKWATVALSQIILVG